ncbi:sodium-dependent proline transporter-like [Tubulanus polymorphus]|uniref:sodium-dependent proline transporter-like n=1 Tax=Tubulanus polymorphus TaxID=672921 RepID=UPI003DA3B165
MDDDISDRSNPFFNKAKWNMVQFGLLCTYTIGFEGLWRFPYFMYEHTALFLVPYYVILVLICIPVVYVQMKLGSVLKSGILGIFCNYMPILKGIAGAILLTTFFTAIYENVYVGYTIYYMFCSLSKPFIWEKPWLNEGNTSKPLNIYSGSSNAYLYFHELFLQSKGASISNLGIIPWYLGLILLTAWLLVWACICRGANLLGWVAYVTGPLSIFMMLIVMFYGYAAIPGSSKSLSVLFNHYSENRNKITWGGFDTDIRAYMNQLKSPYMWIDALTLHVYTLGLWAGVLPMMGSHLGEKKRGVNLAWVLLLFVQGILPNFCAIAIAPYIYGLASSRGISITKVMSTGTSLTFITMPEAFSQLDVVTFIPFAFFLFVLIYALHHQAVMLMAIQDTIAWFNPRYLKSVFRRFELMSGAFCLLGFFVGLAYTTKGGSEFYRIVDSYIMRLLFVLIVVSIPPLFLAFWRSSRIVSKPVRIIVALWFGLSCFAVTNLLMYHFIVNVYPLSVVSFEHRWAETFGWAVAASPILICVPLGAVHAVRCEHGRLWQRLIDAWKPREDGVSIITVAHVMADVDGNVATKNWEDCGTIKMIRRTVKSGETELEIGIKPSQNGEIAQV